MQIKKTLSFAIAAALLAGNITTASAALPQYGEELENAPSSTFVTNFIDVNQNYWAAQYIAEMVNRKVISGYPDGKFRPNNTITRAEFAKIMVTASGITAKKVNYSSFSDIPVTSWSSPFVESVKDYMTGYRTANGQYIFNPSAPATREDVAIALVKLKGYDTSRLPDHSTIEAMFKDYAGISQSARDYVALAVENGLVSGFEDGTFRPQATVTRAEATVMLWRAYQYGNDNKGIGDQGGSPATPSTQPSTTTPSTTPSAPSTQPSTNQSQQPSQVSKFSVDTLVGGTGRGDIDGPVNVAKINYLASMVLDKDDNIYFLNPNLDQYEQKVRKFNKSNGTVETFKTINSEFNWDYLTDEKSVTHYDYQSFRANKLAYNNSNNTVYMLGNNNNTALVFELMPIVTLSTYHSLYLGDNSNLGRFIRFDDNNNIIFGTGSGDTATIFASQPNSKANITAAFLDNTGVPFGDSSSPIEMMSMDNNILVFDTSENKLSKIQLFPRKVETVVTFDKISFNSITSYNGDFYASSGSTIYVINPNGTMKTFIDGKSLTYNDGKPIQQIKQISFDSKGNVIIYDELNAAIRQIHL